MIGGGNLDIHIESFLVILCGICSIKMFLSYLNFKVDVLAEHSKAMLYSGFYLGVQVRTSNVGSL